MGPLEKFLPKNDRYAALLLCDMVLATCFNGYDASIMTVILTDQQFVEYYNVDADWTGTVAVLFIGGTLTSLVGRLWALRISIVVMGIGVIVQSVPTTYDILIFGHLLTGLGFGCVYIVTTLYVAEPAPLMLRGSFPFNIALCVSNLIQLPIGLAFIILNLWYPESPGPDNPGRVLRVLCKLRMGDENSDDVLAEYHELIAAQQACARFDTGYKGIFNLYARSLHQAGGIAALNMYAALIYQSLGCKSQALSINGIQAALQLFGRRALLLAGFAIQATTLLILSSLTNAFPENNNRVAAVVEVAMLFVVDFTYCWSNGPIPPAITTEAILLYPDDSYPAFGSSLLGQTVCLLALTQPWSHFSSQVRRNGYWLLCGLNTMLLISVCFILPETKGVDAVEVDEQERGLGRAEAM
ncbi:MFS general substrate transporter [Macroventuria anomochaeta]|uniref:MFS general substrate transporter n=1 Tax=Macroventuria anomochaeta TaxID=301207 RepID=A0ACB6S597_9PLEO|nr:MFS general substrate transporter [Macroventuria anomochaeta]KAF2628297.1 MFS general substrate transporter [Macroventuria anomochaeta]